MRRHVEGNIFRCWNAYGTQCYLVNAKCFDTILNFPETDAYDNQLADVNLTQYAIHPLPLYHELGSSLLGNGWMQTRDDLAKEPMSCETAVLIIDQALGELQAPVNIHLRLEQCLDLLKSGAHQQELRFLRTVLEKLIATRAEAKKSAHAYFVLSTNDLA